MGGALDGGPIRDGITEGDAEFDDACSAFERFPEVFAGRGEGGVAADEVGDQGGFLPESEAVEAFGDVGDAVQSFTPK